MQVFIGLKLTQQLTQKIEKWQLAAPQNLRISKLILHITLLPPAFVNDQNSYMDAVISAAKNLPSPTLQINGVSWFGASALALTFDPAPFDTLVSSLHHDLHPYYGPRLGGVFRPHATIARANSKIEPADKQAQVQSVYRALTPQPSAPASELLLFSREDPSLPYEVATLIDYR